MSHSRNAAMPIPVDLAGKKTTHQLHRLQVPQNPPFPVYPTCTKPVYPMEAAATATTSDDRLGWLEQKGNFRVYILFLHGLSMFHFPTGVVTLVLHPMDKPKPPVQMSSSKLLSSSCDDTTTKASYKML
jgi:hypothetical protein